MSRYDVNAANTARVVMFRVEPNAAADKITNVFLALWGPNSEYPHYGRIANGTETANQALAQLRLSMVVRALSVYCPPIYVSVGKNSDGEAGGAIFIGFEVDQMGVFYNNAWGTNTALDKHLVTDIVDTVGQPNTPKTKPGLQTLLNQLSTITFDAGVTGPFGAISSTGNITLPDGRVSSAAPILSGDVSPELAGLVVTYYEF